MRTKRNDEGEAREHARAKKKNSRRASHLHTAQAPVSQATMFNLVCKVVLEFKTAVRNDPGKW